LYIFSKYFIFSKKEEEGNLLGKREKVPRRIKERRERKSRRGAERGRKLEDWMRKFLKEMMDRGEIDGFSAHAPHSIADREGKDFTVWRQRNGKHKRASFNITISMRMNAWNNFKMKHPGVPLIAIPPEMKPERVRERILELFEE